MADIESNKAVARRYMQAVVEGDIDTIAALQHPDVEWWVLGFGTLDRETFINAVRQQLLAAESRHLDIITMTAEGDRVAIEARGEMVFPGKVYRNEYHNLLVIRDGRIVEGREYMDTRLAAAAMS